MNKIRGTDSMKIPMTSRLQIGVCVAGAWPPRGLRFLGTSKPTAASGPVPAEFQAGETTFNANCAACHGKQAAGTDHGPPLVHKIYEPHHHGDQAFQRAAANGVRAHHWEFGNMPKIEGVTPGGCRSDREVCAVVATPGRHSIAAGAAETSPLCSQHARDKTSLRSEARS